MGMFSIRNHADAKATVAAFSDALERGDSKTAQAALREIHKVNPKAAEAAVKAAERKSKR